MDQYQLVATVLWGCFQASIVAIIAGLVAQHRHQRGLALTLLFFAVLGTLAFSFVGGFSIGRFTAVIPVLVIGYVVGMDRGPVAVTSCLLGAAFVYLACSWLFTPLVTGGAFSFVFGFWAIPAYAILALAAFGWAVAKPP
jgi:hypothetical protein